MFFWRTRCLRNRKRRLLISKIGSVGPNTRAIELSWRDRFLHWPRFSPAAVPSSYQLRLIRRIRTLWRCSRKAQLSNQPPDVSRRERVVEPVKMWWKWNLPRCFIETKGIIFDPVGPVPTCSNVNSNPSIFHATLVSPGFNKTDGHISCPAVLQVSSASVVSLQFLCMRKEMALENLEKAAGYACRTQWRFSVGDVWEFTQVWVPKSANTCGISKTFLKQLALRRTFFWGIHKFLRNGKHEIPETHDFSS